MTTQATSNNGYVYDPMSWYKVTGRRVILYDHAFGDDGVEGYWDGEGNPVADGKMLMTMMLPKETWSYDDGELLISAEVIRNPDYALAFRNPDYEWMFYSRRAYLALFATLIMKPRTPSLRERKINGEIPCWSHGDKYWDMWEDTYEMLWRRFRLRGSLFRFNDFTNVGVSRGDTVAMDLRALVDSVNSPDMPEFDRVGTNYREYLNSPHWHLVRAAAIVKADYRCQLCNSPDNLQVHHRAYERRGREKLSDVTVLCRDCHRKFHGLSSD